MRINFEDTVYKDRRFQDLIIKLGSIYLAKGMLLTAWELAHKFWLSDKSVPIDSWPKDLQILIDLNWAELTNGGSSVYVRGSREHCKYLEGLQRGGKSRSVKKLNSLKQYNGDGPKLPSESHRALSDALGSNLYTLNTNTVSTKVLTSPSALKAPRGPIPPFDQDNDCKKVLASIAHSTQERWLKLYGSQEFIARSLVKISEWLEINPNRRPRSERGLSQFVTTWLSKDWENYRKTIPSNSKNPKPSAHQRNVST